MDCFVAPLLAMTMLLWKETPHPSRLTRHLLPPRRVGVIMAVVLIATALAVTLLSGVHFDAYGHDMPGYAWVLAGLIGGIMGTKRRRYIVPPEAQA